MKKIRFWVRRYEEKKSSRMQSKTAREKCQLFNPNFKRAGRSTFMVNGKSRGECCVGKARPVHKAGTATSAEALSHLYQGAYEQIVAEQSLYQGVVAGQIIGSGELRRGSHSSVLSQNHVARCVGGSGG